MTTNRYISTNSIIAELQNMAEKFPLDALKLAQLYKNGTGCVPKNISQAIKYYQLAANKLPQASYELGKLFTDKESEYFDHIKAKAYLKKAVKQGHISAGYYLAQLYNSENETAQNAQTALYLYTQAANQGSFDSMNMLGTLYRKGTQYIEQNFKLARKWYAKAAEQGNHQAMLALAQMEKNGEGSKKSRINAYPWYIRAALLGNPNAMNSLGNFHKNGKGVKKDIVKARIWYEQAALQQNSYALNSLGLIYKYGNGVEQNYEIAREYFEEAAELGNINALNNLGLFFQYGHGSQVDFKKAQDYFEKAAEQGNNNAMNNLAIMYQLGQGVTKDIVKAMHWFTLSAESGNKFAMLNLGKVYLEGSKKISKDYNLAYHWLEKSAKKGNEHAMYELGMMYEQGRGVTKTYSFAQKWFELAAKKGHTDAMYKLGLILLRNKNNELAMYWLKKASKKGLYLATTEYGCLCYEDSESMKKEGLKVFKEAYRKGNAHAARMVAVYYDNASRKFHNQQKAIEYYIKATEMGDQESKYRLGQIYTNRGYQLLQKFYLKKVKSLTIELDNIIKAFEQAAVYDNVNAMFELGKIYEHNDMIHDNFSLSVQWYLKAAQAGNKDAYFQLGQLYEYANEKHRDLKEAFNYYQLSSRSSPLAIRKLALCYEQGYMTAKNIKKAKELYSIVAEQGDSDAYVKLGSLHELDTSSTKNNYLDAFDAYTKGAELNNPTAMRKLASLYKRGKGVKQDDDLASYWEKKANKL